MSDKQTTDDLLPRKDIDNGDGTYSRAVYIAGQAAGAGAAADITLMTAAAATSAGVTVTVGTYNWLAWGTWNGATAQIQFSPNAGTTWINIDGTALTADGGFSDIPIGTGSARVLITGAGGSTSLTSKLFGVV